MVYEGDSVMLFQNFPYNFKEQLPIAVGEGVEVVETPNAYLRSVWPSAVVSYVLPGYEVPGYELPQSCLRSAPLPDGDSLPAETRLWLAVLALRLRRPLLIHISGIFVVREPPSIESASNVNARCTWVLGTESRYSGNDFRAAFEINRRIIEVGSFAQRISTAIVLFSHASCGHVQSIQAASLCLFAALEAVSF